jgi:hypothetical protein
MGQMAGGFGGRQPFMPESFYDLPPDRQQKILDRVYGEMGFRGGLPEFEAMQQLQRQIAGREARRRMFSNIRRRMLSGL